MINIYFFFISETCGWHADLPLVVSLLSFSGIKEGSHSYCRAFSGITEGTYSYCWAFSILRQWNSEYRYVRTPL